MDEKVKFKIGDRVGRSEDINHYRLDDAPIFGEVKDLTVKDLVVVQWDNYSAGSVKIIDSNKLMLQSEIEAKQSAMEQIFLKVQSEITVKMQQAADAISEANRLADQAGVNLHEMYDAIDPLYSAMDNAGWNTSSFSC